MLVLSGSIAYAGIFDWITGRVTEGIGPIKEEVKCVFINSNSEQKCYTDDGKFACSEITSCAVEVSGENGKSLRWKSSCGGEAYTTIDSNNEYAEFKCEQTQIVTPPAIPAAELIKEQVKCVFINSNSEQKCYTSDGKFACSGIESCLAEVYGAKETKLEWKSLCSAYPAYTFIDEKNDYAEFKCAQEPATPTPLEIIKENIRCLFANSNSAQKCYTDDGRFACSGSDGCEVEVSGEKGKNLNWKSTCSGYFSTTIDGGTKDLAFKCESTTAIPRPQPVMKLIKEQVKCVFANSASAQKCYTSDGKFACSGTESCLSEVYGAKETKLEWKSTCQKPEYPPYTLIDGSPEQVWFNCEGISSEALPVPAILSPAPVTEQVKCTFIDPDPMLKHSCGTSGGSCTWIWDGIKTEAMDKRMGPLLEKEINGEKVKYASCTAEVIGENGEKKTWRSTCGGEANTVIDNVNEEVEFRCLSDRQVNIGQISGKGFRYAFWWCQGGVGASPPPLGNEEVCKTADAWKKLAEDYCDNSCHKDISGKEKCGLYSFSVSQECYFATEAEREAAQKMPITGEELKMRQASAPKMMAAVLIYSYHGECPECPELEASSANKMPLKTEDRAKTTDFRYANFNYKQFLDKYPNENVLLSLEIMTEIRDGEAKAYAKVYEMPGKIDFKTAEDWWRTQVLTNAIEPVFNTLPTEKKVPEVVPPQKVPKNDVLVYVYNGECPECSELDKIKVEFGIEVSAQNKEKTSMVLAVVAALKSFLEEHKDENYLIFGRYAGDDLALYAKAGKMDYSETGDWIRQIRAGKLSPTGIVGKTEEEIKRQIEKQTEKQKPEKQRPEEQKPEEEVIICKDSCPLDRKCYPFGYRKSEKYCSDEGMFKEQLKEDVICENNFECSTNVCVDGKCISSGLIQKITNWLKKLFGLVDREKAKEDIIKIMDCGTSTECLENAFKVCNPAKMSQSQGGPISEIAIVGLEGKNCVLKFVAGTESMTCKFENYALGMKDIGPGSLEQYCSGPLTFRLAAAPKIMKLGEMPVPNSVVTATKLSADPNDPRYSFTAHDPDGVREFSIVKSNFGEVAIKAEPPCAKEFTSELKFSPSDLPFRASVIDCGTPVTRQELKVDIQILISPASAPETKHITEMEPQRTKQKNIQEPISATLPQQKTPMLQQAPAMPVSSRLSKEQVKCNFIDPELIQRCYADFGKLGCQNMQRKCYTDDGKFGCSWTGGITSEPIDGKDVKGFKYIPDCVAEVHGEQGTKLTWKGSCGESSYTVIDRSNEDATFMCMPLGSQIKGFLHAYWKCGNGAEEKSIEGVDLTTCKSKEMWEEYTKESCKNLGSLNDFSVSGECSISVQKEGVFIST